MTFRLERDMTPIVTDWLAQRCAHVHAEMGFPWGICDLVGCTFDLEHVRLRTAMRQRTLLSMKAFDEPNWQRPWMPLYRDLIAVELKLSRQSEVLAQATSHARVVTESWIAMPRRYAVKTIEAARFEGLGVLAVELDGCEVLLPPNRNACNTFWPWFPHQLAERFWRRHRNDKPPRRLSGVT